MDRSMTFVHRKSRVYKTATVTCMEVGRNRVGCTRPWIDLYCLNMVKTYNYCFRYVKVCTMLLISTPIVFFSSSEEYWWKTCNLSSEKAKTFQTPPTAQLALTKRLVCMSPHVLWWWPFSRFPTRTTELRSVWPRRLVGTTSVFICPTHDHIQWKFIWRWYRC